MVKKNSVQPILYKDMLLQGGFSSSTQMEKNIVSKRKLMLRVECIIAPNGKIMKYLNYLNCEIDNSIHHLFLNGVLKIVGFIYLSNKVVMKMQNMKFVQK
jgi:hypothetical protein